MRSKDSLGELEYNILLTKWSEGCWCVWFVFPPLLLHCLTNNGAVTRFCTVTSHCQHYDLVSEHQAKKQHVLASCLKVYKGVRPVIMAKVTSRAAFLPAKWYSLFRRRPVPSLAAYWQCSVVQCCNAYCPQTPLLTRSFHSLSYSTTLIILLGLCHLPGLMTSNTFQINVSWSLNVCRNLCKYIMHRYNLRYGHKYLSQGAAQNFRRISIFSSTTLSPQAITTHNALISSN